MNYIFSIMSLYGTTGALVTSGIIIIFIIIKLIFNLTFIDIFKLLSNFFKEDKKEMTDIQNRKLDDNKDMITKIDDPKYSN